MINNHYVYQIEDVHDDSSLWSTTSALMDRPCRWMGSKDETETNGRTTKEKKRKNED